MVKQMVTGYSPQADAQKTAPIKGTDEEKGQAGSEALSLFFLDSNPVGEVKGMVEWMETFKEIRLPEVSGFRMSRKV